MTVRVICLHGPESTGKSTLAEALGQTLDAEVVPEYGRLWCETHGAETSMADLITIASEHRTRIHAARARALEDGRAWLVLDTDPVMTAVWARMLYGRPDPFFDEIENTADLYVVPDIDLPWINDGLRYLGGEAERQRFMALSIAELEQRHLPYVIVSGEGPRRLEMALAKVKSLTAS